MKLLRTSALDRLVAITAAVLIAVLASVAGCGGGVGVGGTGAFASGPITGFGSIIVAGIEFEDSTARVVDDDGAASSRSVLRLGMVTEVESGPVGGSADAPTATATTVRYASELLGPVASVNPAASTLVVFGQTVKVSATTVFDDTLTSGLASVVPGSVVEVYGFFDGAAGSYVATRIEPRTAPAFFKLHGPVSALDAAAHSFAIGGIGFSFVTLPAGLANGELVRVRSDTTTTNGRWGVRSVGEGRPRLPDTDRARLRGPISAFTSSRAFSVNGQVVDAATASFPDGEAGLALGVRVDIEGSAVAGVLRATVVQIDDDGGAQGGFELKGGIDSVQPVLQTFVLRGVTVFYGAPALEFQDGTAADIKAGAQVEVRGLLTGGGTRLLATRIKFKK